MPHTFALIPASYVYLLRGDEVLLQRRAATGYMDGHGVAGAAGHVEPGETARAAAVRETAEELGVRIRPQDLELLTVMQRTDGAGEPVEQRVDWFWAVRRWEGEPRLCEPAKASGLDWFARDTLPAPMPAYERRVVRGIDEAGLPAATSFGFGADD